ncbi:MAG: flagellar hook-basal body complex protein, partial [Rhodospirillales bacterium]|nr:flagellar hook-basal body complex protein [Rhodospirillales bacterium]
MSLLGLFAASVHGMTSQSDAMNAIAGNIANLRTGGYKRTDVQFATVLSQSISSENGSGGSASGSSQADFGGAIANNYARIATQGQIEASDRPLDIAINGNRGFFVVSPELDGSGESLFTRDGTFSIDVGADTTVMGIGGTPITVQEGYLVDKNGYFLQGWEYDPNGAYGSDLSSMQPLRVDNFAFSGVGEATTSAELSLNLPATESAGDFESFLIDVVDSAGNPWGLQTHFIKDTSVNSWLFDIAVAGGGSGTSVTLSPPADYSVSTEATQETVFDATTGTIRVQEAGTGVLAIDALRGLTAGDSFTIAGTALNDGTYTVQSVAADGASLIVDPATPLAADETTATTTTISASGVLGQSLSFAPDGSLASPTQYVVAITHPGGTTSNFTLDVSSITQFAGAFQPGA